MSNDNIIPDNDWIQSPESKRQHLEFIQNVITRMNSNSFQIKQFAVLIVTALLGVYATNKNTLFIFIGIVPTIACWFLDAYYLLTERKFRGLYNDIVRVPTTVVTPPTYGMDISPYTCNKKYGYIAVLFSLTMWFYIISILAIVLGAVGGFMYYDIKI